MRSGAGQCFDRLAEFLAADSALGRTGSVPQIGFVTMYVLNKLPLPQSRQGGIYEIQTCEEFKRLQAYKHTGSKNSLIFLKGYPSPGWLRTLGSTYGIDPEFFRSHFEYDDTSLSAGRAAMLTLPSSSWRMFKLNITTIEMAENTKRRDISSEERRKSNDASMKDYIRRLLSGGATTGDPIVRHFSTIDATHFVIEQRISVYLHLDGRHWTSRHDRLLCHDKSTYSNSCCF